MCTNFETHIIWKDSRLLVQRQTSYMCLKSTWTFCHIIYNNIQDIMIQCSEFRICYDDYIIKLTHMQTVIETCDSVSSLLNNKVVALLLLSVELPNIFSVCSSSNCAQVLVVASTHRASISWHENWYNNNAVCLSSALLSYSIHLFYV